MQSEMIVDMGRIGRRALTPHSPFINSELRNWVVLGGPRSGRTTFLRDFIKKTRRDFGMVVCVGATTAEFQDALRPADYRSTALDEACMDYIRGAIHVSSRVLVIWDNFTIPDSDEGRSALENVLLPRAGVYVTCLLHCECL